MAASDGDQLLEPAGSKRVRKPRRHPWRALRGWTGAAGRTASDWLDRPMTSLHLVMAIFLLMLGFGLLMVLSSSAVSSFRTGGSSFSVFANQATYAVLGLVCFAAAQYLPIGLLRSTSTAAVIISLALLVAVLVPGIGALVNGARSWIRIGGLQFQPSEMAKLALLLWMAHVLAARRSTLGRPRQLLLPGAAGVRADGRIDHDAAGPRHHGRAHDRVPGGVVLRRRAVVDLRQPRRGRGSPGSSPLPCRPNTEWRGCCRSSIRRRTRTSSYQLLQSLYGMGNGGWFGVGLGQSRAKWSYLPNADSDFIFAIVGEELGLIGAGILIVLFALLAYTGLRIARRNVDPFVKIVASAATVWLVGQAAINIGYVVGLLPVTGIPLPMISAGGTSLLITMVVFGLLANFARREPQAVAALAAGGGGTGSAGSSGMRSTPTTAAGEAAPARVRRPDRRRRRGDGTRCGAGAPRGRPSEAGAQRVAAPTHPRPSRRGAQKRDARTKVAKMGRVATEIATFVRAAGS